MGAANSRHLRKNAVDAVSAAVPKQAAVKIQLERKPEILLNNLGKIGQVNVDSPLSSIQTSQHMTHVIRTRNLSESPSTTTIDAHGLSQLFDLHKNTPQLTDKFKIDSTLVEQLMTRYNSVSIGRETTRILADGEQRTYREAIWVDPPYKD